MCKYFRRDSNHIINDIALRKAYSSCFTRRRSGKLAFIQKPQKLLSLPPPLLLLPPAIGLVSALARIGMSACTFFYRLKIYLLCVSQSRRLPIKLMCSACVRACVRAFFSAATAATCDFNCALYFGRNVITFVRCEHNEPTEHTICNLFVIAIANWHLAPPIFLSFARLFLFSLSNIFIY